MTKKRKKISAMMASCIILILIASCSEHEPIDKEEQAEEIIEEELEEQTPPDACDGYNHVHAVDLGLSVKWACCNVDASTPEEYGGFYAWGETEEKNNYNDFTYKYATINHDTTYSGNSTSVTTTIKNIYIGNCISGTSYDVAHIKWGNGWRMPTRNELEELITECTWEWTKREGVKGMLFTGPNGNCIFFPAAGYHWGLGEYESRYYNEGGRGIYQTGTLKNPDSGQFVLEIYQSGISHSYGGHRASGYSVRPVKEY